MDKFGVLLSYVGFNHYSRFDAVEMGLHAARLATLAHRLPCLVWKGKPFSSGLKDGTKPVSHTLNTGEFQRRILHQVDWLG